MTVATLAEVLSLTRRDGYAVAGLVCLGWEDMRAFVVAAEAESAPIILQAGPGARAHTPLPVIGKMMRHLAEQATVPVVVHLDHGYTLDECRAAIDCGFSSVMFDGSKLALEHNISQTAVVVTLAHGAGISCEGEIGVVGYAGGTVSHGTDPAEAQRFARETGVDALAISVGNVHLQQEASEGLDENRIRAIASVTDVPLVIHGGSGVPVAQRSALAQQGLISKFNIGTELRMAFGAALRASVTKDAARFDRLALLKDTEEPVCAAARNVLRGVLSSGRATTSC
jgi:fructose-bisphosphate aldolase, class II